MKKRALIVITVLCVVLSLFCVAASAIEIVPPLDFGDFGGGADYGGNDDWGGGGNDWGGGNNWGGGSTVIIGDFDTPTVVIIAAVIVIACIVIAASKKKNTPTVNNRPVTNVPKATPASALRPMESYKELDPNFSAADMEAKISNVFVRLQAAWMAKNLDDVRTCLTDEFFTQTDRQLDAYRNSNQTNVIERIAVLGVSLTGWDQNGKNDRIIARVSARMADYVVDAAGNVVRGSKTADKFMEYEWTLVRTTGKKTGVDNDKERKNCPYCGAPLEINRSAKCEYCGNIVSTNDYDWCLASIRGLSQRTVMN